MTKYFTTPVVDQISAAKIYIDPAVWSKIIIHPKSKKPNWLAIHLFARILYWYTRSEVRDEITGKFLGYKKKFKYHKLLMSRENICEQMGCTPKEARVALECLEAANLITREVKHTSWQGNLLFIEPIVENILCIINPKGVYNNEETECDGPVGPLSEWPSRYQASLTTNTLNKTNIIKGGSSVDNSGQLPTSEPPPIKKILKNDYQSSTSKRPSKIPKPNMANKALPNAALEVKQATGKIFKKIPKEKKPMTPQQEQARRNILEQQLAQLLGGDHASQ